MDVDDGFSRHGSSLGLSVGSVMKRMKVGQLVSIVASHWHGDDGHGNREGITIQIGPDALDTRMEIDLTFEELGKMVSGVGGEGTLTRLNK